MLDWLDGLISFALVLFLFSFAQFWLFRDETNGVDVSIFLTLSNQRSFDRHCTGDNSSDVIGMDSLPLCQFSSRDLSDCRNGHYFHFGGHDGDRSQLPLQGSDSQASSSLDEKVRHNQLSFFFPSGFLSAFIINSLLPSVGISIVCSLELKTSGTDHWVWLMI